MNVKEIISVTLILFSVIDILGNIPVILTLKEQGKIIESGKATLAAGLLMVLFLFAGESILHLIGIDVASFALAGAFVIFVIGLEMILGITLFKEEENASQSSSIVPLAFPLIAGAGTLTTILSLKAEYQELNIGIGIAVAGYLISQAYRVAEASYVAPFEYLALPMSVVWGMLVFDEFPGGWDYFGMALILGAGLFAIWRDAQTRPAVLQRPFRR